MKKLLWMIFAILLLPVCADATITDVNIIPSTPTLLDPITILVSGREGCGPVQIINTDFLVNDNTLLLDISLRVGFLTVVTPWSHSEEIGTLSQGLYNINVRTLQEGIITSTYSTSFEVTPEPATSTLLLTAGVFLFRRRR
ncbi:MAG: PEP-CTERM sorting domain-containing protein [Sedimentisphaerales bacterium]